MKRRVILSENVNPVGHPVEPFAIKDVESSNRFDCIESAADCFKADEVVEVVMFLRDGGKIRLTVANVGSFT